MLISFISFIQPVGGGMFGRSLAETVRFETRRGGGYVPFIVQKCVDFIRANGKPNCFFFSFYVLISCVFLQNV